MNNEDRYFIYTRLAERAKPEVVAHELLMRRAMEEVNKVAAEMAGDEARSQLMTGLRFYTIYGPLPKPIKIKDSVMEGEMRTAELWQQQARQEYRVKVSDLPQFCREHKLDLKAMTEVVTGKRWDYNDWLCMWSGSSMDAGQQADPPKVTEQQEAATREKQREPVAPARKESVYNPAPPMIVWTPKK